MEAARRTSLTLARIYLPCPLYSPSSTSMNISGTVNVFRLLLNPALCLPHHTISTFDQLPIPLSAAFAQHGSSTEKQPNIRAVILDKDNCFAIPKQDAIYPPYQPHFDKLRAAYPGSRLLIVSNRAGSSSDIGDAEAELLERNTGVTVLRHGGKKPGCHETIMDFLRSDPGVAVTRPDQVAVVGDRLFTDVMMGNLMGARSVWVRDGVVPDSGIVCSRSSVGGESKLMF